MGRMHDTDVVVCAVSLRHPLHIHAIIKWRLFMDNLCNILHLFYRMQERPKKDESEVAKFLRESESGGKAGQPGSEEGEYRGGGSAANKQSMSFRVLQWMTDTDKSEADTDSRGLTISTSSPLSFSDIYQF